MEKKSAIAELGISTAAAAGSGIVGGLMNQLFAGSNDRRQIRQQQKLTDMQVTANKQMADYEQELGLKMWKDTNYPAQVEMMKAAGLNPAAVLSNGGGGSGATGASAAGVAGGQAANAAQTQANQNELGLQMAQMQLMQAQTEKTKAEAENIAGVDRENTIADTAVKQATAEIQKVAARVAKDTEADQIREITYAANEQVEKYREQFNKAQVAEETQQSEIKKIKQEGQNEILKGAAIRQGIKLDQAKIKEITANINNMLDKVELHKGDQKIAVENMEKLTEAMLWGAGINAAGNLVKGFIDLRTGGITTTTTETKKSGNTTTSTSTTKRK